MCPHGWDCGNVDGFLRLPRFGGQMNKIEVCKYCGIIYEVLCNDFFIYLGKH